MLVPEGPLSVELAVTLAIVPLVDTTADSGATSVAVRAEVTTVMLVDPRGTDNVVVMTCVLVVKPVVYVSLPVAVYRPSPSCPPHAVPDGPRP